MSRRSPKMKKSPVKKSPVKRSPVKKPVKKSPIKIRERKSPNTHANEHKVNSVMRGLDGNMWKIICVTKKDGSKYKRWSKV